MFSVWIWVTAENFCTDAQAFDMYPWAGHGQTARVRVFWRRGRGDSDALGPSIATRLAPRADGAIGGAGDARSGCARVAVLTVLVCGGASRPPLSQTSVSPAVDAWGEKGVRTTQVTGQHSDDRWADAAFESTLMRRDSLSCHPVSSVRQPGSGEFTLRACRERAGNVHFFILAYPLSFTEGSRLLWICQK